MPSPIPFTARLRVQVDRPVSRRAVLKTAPAAIAALHGAMLADLPGHRAQAHDASPVASADYPGLAITTRDFTFDAPATVEGGWVAVTMHNEGPQPHHIMFVRLREGVTAADFSAAAARGDEAMLFQLGDAVGGPGGVLPGTASTVILNLEPGEYFLVCSIPSPNERPHFMDGMVKPLTVTPPTAEREPPRADRSVDLIDFAFTHLSTSVPAGAQVWEVTNDGSEPHELVLAQIAPGADFEMLRQSLGLATPAPAATSDGHAGHAGGTPNAVAVEELLQVPIIPVTGVAPYSPGFTNYLVADLPAGDYALLCFIGSPSAGGAPHFALGMIMPLTVE